MGYVVRLRHLSRPGYDAAVEALATSRRAGQALLLWRRDPPHATRPIGDRLIAGLVSAGGAYSGEEIVMRGRYTNRAAVAFDPVDGRPIVVWADRATPDESDPEQLVASTRSR